MPRNTKLGIRREDKNDWERRAPLTPEQVARLIAQGIEVVIQPSRRRAFSDEDYLQAGAQVREDLDDCRLVLAVKEIPLDFFKSGCAYMYFAHVIKGQPYNMPMLAKLIELGCTLMDYEKITDQAGKRLVFFGRHAGLAGMTDTLWALGRRLSQEGLNTPFAEVKPAHAYADLKEIKQAVGRSAERLRRDGLPEKLTPMVFGFTGYGNVSNGAQEIFDLLPHKEVQPHELEKIGSKESILKVVFKEEHLVRPKDLKDTFELQHYYDHPELYESDFERYLPVLTVLVNCIYWAPRYPRLVTKQALKHLWENHPKPRLRVIGDITCDVEGSIECCLKCTEPGDPVFVYQPQDGQIAMGVAGRGPVVLAVDNLPCELPRESSHDFGEALMQFVPAIVRADFQADFDELDLPLPIKRAVIAHAGDLAPGFRYLRPCLGGRIKGGGRDE